MKAAAWVCVVAAIFPWPGMAQNQPAAAAPAAPAQPAAAGPAASPVPSTDQWFSGWLESGYRWDIGVGGSLETYRSFVNLGEGPKLSGAEFTVTDPRRRLFDQVQVRAYNWGDEPSETLHVDAIKKKWYELNADYRDIAFFDNLPSFADPLAARGVFLNEQSFDTRKHLGSYSLDLLPGNWLIPYLGFERDAESGAGVDTFVSLPNEFPVPYTTQDLTNLYRGGVRIERRRMHLTLEQGGTTFAGNQDQFQSGTTNFGNNLVPYFGHNISLQSLLTAYGIRGSSIYSTGLLTANPTSWLDLHGQFLYSQPETNVNYSQNAAGNLVLQNQVLFYTGQAYLVTSAAKLPHTSGSFGGEIRPLKRVRIFENWLTDRLRGAGSSGSLNQLLTAPNATTQIAALLESSLASNYSQNEINILYDPWARLSIRAGYRYVWGDAADAVLPPAGLASADRAKMHSNVGLAGFTLRPMKAVTLSGSGEFAASRGSYFRTSLYNYQRIQAKARYQVTKTLNLAADFLLLNNHDPQPGVDYEYSSHQESMSLIWTPPQQNWDFEGSYTRATVYSNIGYREPETLGPQVSLYRDNAHTASALFHLKLRRPKGPAPALMGGGSVFLSSGSRPTSYYQPILKASMPWGKRTTLFAQWTYYGYGEAFYGYEGFRTHLVTAGLRFTPWGG